MWVFSWTCCLLVAVALAEWVPVPVIDHRTSDKRPTPPQGAPPPAADYKAQENVTADLTAPEGPPPPGEGVDEVLDEGGLPLHDLKEAHLELLRQSKEPVSGKLRFLQQLHDRLLRHVAELVPQTVSSLVRSGRDLEAREGRGHKGIGFPSNEGTLLSLCFLVFAVFLVKVVMQLIYAVQNSQASAAGTAGVRVAQMPDGMLPEAMGMGMGMVPAMMPPMMGASDAEAAAAAGGGARARREAAAEAQEHAAETVMEAIRRAHAKFAWSDWDPA